MSDHVFGSAEAFKQICAHLVLHGVTLVEVTFDGSGDSGSISGVSLIFREGSESQVAEQELLNAKLQAVGRKSEFNQSSRLWDKKTFPAVLPLREILEAATYEALERSGHDWYNNDGGYGTLRLELDGDKPELVLDVAVRITQTDDYSYDLADGPLRVLNDEI